MYAIVDIAGQQFKVNKAGKVYVHRLQAEEGSQIELKNVLLIDNDKNVEVGKPTIAGAHVLAEVVEHLKGDKVLVFHKKRRKGYQKMNGHRQYLTRLNILSIVKDGVSLTGDNAPSVKKQVKEAALAKTKKEKIVANKEVEKEVTAEKKAAPKKTTTTKTAEKKADTTTKKATTTTAKKTTSTTKKATTTTKKATTTTKKDATTTTKKTTATAKKEDGDKKSTSKE
ncbi:MAG: 50S ribosomal protein L21 [Bacteroidales bacterium]|nr:50S ribosomal protein L21 [Bacteroidales bacterium]